MITVKTGPAFGELRTLEQQLEASQFLLAPSRMWSDANLERAHVWVELLFLEQAKK